MKDVRLMSTGGRALCCPLKGHGMQTGSLCARPGSPKGLVVTNMTRTRGRHCDFEMWDRRRRAKWVPCRTYSSSELSSSSLSTLALGDAAAAWGTAGAVPFPSIDSMGSWLPEP